MCEKELGLKIPKDFFVLAGSAMVHLSKKKLNIIWQQVLALCEQIVWTRTLLHSRCPWDWWSTQPVFFFFFFVADDLNQVLPNYSIITIISQFIKFFLLRSQVVLRILPVAADYASLVRNG